MLEELKKLLRKYYTDIIEQCQSSVRPICNHLYKHLNKHLYLIRCIYHSLISVNDYNSIKIKCNKFTLMVKMHCTVDAF